MNRLPTAKRSKILQMMVEGMSMRSIARTADVSKDTVAKLLVDFGRHCTQFHDQMVRDLNCKRVQCDEIWSFVHSKQKNTPGERKGVAGDAWTWTSFCPDSKLICNWVVGTRDAEYAYCLMSDLKERLKNRVQLTTDGYHGYLEAVENTFGADIDYAQLVKIYGGGNNRYKGSVHQRIEGNPNQTHISTSLIERSNLTIRMGLKRFTRKTNAFSKKIINHHYALAIFFVHYNFCRIHQTLRVTPAMEAGITSRVWNLDEIIELMNNQQFPAKRGPYKKRAA